MQGRQGAGRVQGQGTEGRAGLQGLKTSKSRFCNFLREGRAGQGLGSERLGAGQHRARGRAKARAKGRAACRAGRAQAGCRGRAQAGRRQGAGRVQGQGTEGRAGLQDSILRFSRPENIKITFLQLFEKKGQGGCRGRAQRAGQGCKIPF